MVVYTRRKARFIRCRDPRAKELWLDKLNWALLANYDEDELAPYERSFDAVLAAVEAEDASADAWDAAYEVPSRAGLILLDPFLRSALCGHSFLGARRGH